MKIKSCFIAGGLAAATLMPVRAQQITGKVVSPDSLAVDGATVVLQTSDSVFVDAVITETDGSFRLPHQLPEYRLIFQHILYQTREVDGHGSDAGTVVMQPKDYALGEVVVRGERPVVQVESGRLSYNIPQLMENKLVTNAYECIKELPGVMEQDGKLTLAGSPSLSLILNGTPSSMTYDQLVNTLKSLPASRVEKAEVMYSAPPQYHVRGGAINIVLRGYRPGDQRLQGEISGSYVQNREAGANGRLTLAYASPKIDVDLMYHADYVPGHRQDMELATRHTVKGEIYDITQFMNGTSDRMNHNFRLGATYKPKEKSRLDLTYTGTVTPSDKGHILASSNISRSDNQQKKEEKMHNLAVGYTGTSGLKAGADYTYYSSSSLQDFTDTPTDEANGELFFNSHSRQRIDRWKGYADMSHTLGHGWTLNYGALFTYVSNRNSQWYEQSSSDMNDLYTDNRINEYTGNVYAGFEKAFGAKWSLAVSAAAEYYKMGTYKKWAVYPTLNLSYMPSGTHIFQLSFSSDKTYPDYWTLSGATGYMSRYAESTGNPYLKPYTDYAGTLAYILKSKYVFQASYSYSPDYFIQMIYLDSERLQAVYNYRNWDYLRNFSLTALIPVSIGGWYNANFTLVAQHARAKASDYYDAPFDRKQWTGIGVFSSTFALSKQPDIKLELSAFGQTKAIQGSYEIEPIGMIGAGLKWTFAQNKAMLQLKGDDIFNGMKPKTKVRNGAQVIDMHVWNFRRALTLTFSYKFGGYKEKKAEKVDTSRFGL